MLITISAARITPAAWAEMSLEDKADVVRKARAADKELPKAVRAWEKAANAWKSLPLIKRFRHDHSEADKERIRKGNEAITKEYEASRKLAVEYNKVMELARHKVSSNYTPAKALNDGKLIRSYLGDSLLERDNQGFPTKSMAAFERYKNSKDWYYDIFRFAGAILKRKKRSTQGSPHESSGLSS